jgi:hypothetical protein
MNIIFVSSLTPAATANYLLNALRRAGHALLVLSDVSAPMVDVPCGPDPDIASLCAARAFVPDFALFVEGGTMQLFPTGLEALPCPTAWYGIDTHMDYRKHAELSRMFDLTFVAQRQYVGDLERDGACRVEWLPLAFPSEHLHARSSDRTIDIAFVGSVDPRMHPARSGLLEALSEASANCVFGGASPEEMFRRYSHAKIVFNRSVKNDVNMRYFEAMGSGAALLTDIVADNGVEELFEPGRHFVQYRDRHDLLAQCRALLADPARCAAMGSAAQELVLARHTYDHRAVQLVDCVSTMDKSVRPDPARYFAAFGALNMPAASLRAVASEFARMGQRSRLSPLYRVVGMLLRTMAALLGFAIRTVRYFAKH